MLLRRVGIWTKWEKEWKGLATGRGNTGAWPSAGAESRFVWLEQVQGWRRWGQRCNQARSCGALDGLEKHFRFYPDILIKIIKNFKINLGKNWCIFNNPSVHWRLYVSLTMFSFPLFPLLPSSNFILKICFVLFFLHRFITLYFWVICRYFIYT